MREMADGIRKITLLIYSEAPFDSKNAGSGKTVFPEPAAKILQKSKITIVFYLTTNFTVET